MLTSPIGDWKSVELSVDAPILERIRVGDTVVGVVWRDDVIWIKAKGLKERTVDTPVHPESLLGAMLAADPAGMLIVAVCVWRLRHRRRRLTRGMWVLLGLAFGSLATGVAVSVAGARLDLPLWFGPAAWLLVMANLTVLAVVTARRPAQPAPAPASNWGKEFGS